MIGPVEASDVVKEHRIPASPELNSVMVQSRWSLSLTYGILAHGIRTNSMNTDDFEGTRDGLLQDNKPFIPNAEIKYIGWLTRSSPTKSASSIIVEFMKAEDANKIIDEGLIWQGEVFQCER